MKTKIIFSLLATVICLSACKKDKTEYQPAGAYVTTGSNNNTVKTYDFTVLTSDWTDLGNEKTYTYTGIPVSTSMDGAVMVYYKGTTNQYTALPLIINSTQSMQFTFSTYWSIDVYLEGLPAQLCSFRAVIIPPGGSIGKVNINNYAEVKQAFNLKD